MPHPSQPRRVRALPGEHDPRRYVFVEAPRCPACDGRELRTYRSTRREADGSVARHSRCAGCGHRCIVISE